MWKMCKTLWRQGLRRLRQYYFFARLSNFCRKTAAIAPSFDGKPLAPPPKMRYNIWDILCAESYNPWRFPLYAKEERIQRRQYHQPEGR